MKNWTCKIMSLGILFLLFSLLITATAAGAALTESQQAIYNNFLSGVVAGQAEIIMENLNCQTVETDFQTVFETLSMEHPELFWLIGYALDGETYDNISCRVRLSPKYNVTGDWLRQRQEALDTRLSEIQNAVNQFPSDYDKLLFIHDYLVQHTEYDSAAASAMLDPGNSGNAYGCLVEGRAVCAGYSAAFQLLLSRCGIPSRRVSGFAEGVPHSWNVVYLDGEYGYIDVTFDDPIDRDGTVSPSDPVSHTYFGLSLDEILRDHIFESSEDAWSFPEPSWNYYRHSGLYLDSYDPARVRQMLSSNRSSGMVELRAATPEILAQVKRDFLEGAQIYDLIPAQQIRYSVEGTILRIYW